MSQNANQSLSKAFFDRDGGILPLAHLEPIGPFATPRPSMRGRYLIRHPLKALAVALMDAGLSLIPSGSAVLPEQPERILVANWAHIGDVTTSIGALAALRERFPDARIGMLVGSWGRVAIENIGLLDDIHIIDHWRVNRADLSRTAKRRQFRDMRERALREIRAVGYQVAIDLSPFFPPAHPVFRMAGIPVRIGYTSCGFGPLLTHPMPWRDEERPMADQYRDLLDRLAPARRFDPDALRPRRPRETLAALPPAVAAAGRYIVVHPGAGAATRHWGIERWRAVIARLQVDAGDHAIVLTGAGSAEIATADALAGLAPNVISMAGRASWEEFVRILADAALVICPDTATGHVAALFDVPVVTLFTGTNSPAKWAPYTDRLRVLVRPVLCAPCNRSGCTAMACFRDIDPAAVADAALDLLGGSARP